MIPQLSPLDLATSPTTVEVPPPPSFIPPQGAIHDAIRSGHIYVFGPDSLSPTQKAGLRYEDKAQQMLSAWNRRYEASPDFTFRDDSGRRLIRPDGYVWLTTKIFIFEIKIRHMPEAYWQLMKLYKPVLQARHPQHKVVCVEVCGSFDPSMPFPCAFDMVSLETLADFEGDLGVLVWTPK